MNPEVVSLKPKPQTGYQATPKRPNCSLLLGLKGGRAVDRDVVVTLLEAVEFPEQQASQNGHLSSSASHWQSHATVNRIVNSGTLHGHHLHGNACS